MTDTVVNHISLQKMKRNPAVIASQCNYVFLRNACTTVSLDRRRSKALMFRQQQALSKFSEGNSY